MHYKNQTTEYLYTKCVFHSIFCPSYSLNRLKVPLQSRCERGIWTATQYIRPGFCAVPSLLAAHPPNKVPDPLQVLDIWGAGVPPRIIIIRARGLQPYAVSASSEKVIGNGFDREETREYGAGGKELRALLADCCRRLSDLRSSVRNSEQLCRYLLSCYGPGHGSAGQPNCNVAHRRLHHGHYRVPVCRRVAGEEEQQDGHPARCRHRVPDLHPVRLRPECRSAVDAVPGRRHCRRDERRHAGRRRRRPS